MGIVLCHSLIASHVAIHFMPAPTLSTLHPLLMDLLRLSYFQVAWFLILPGYVLWCCLPTLAATLIALSCFCEWSDPRPPVNQAARLFSAQAVTKATSAFRNQQQDVFPSSFNIIGQHTTIVLFFITI